jgi:N-methylhydantoinase A
MENYTIGVDVGGTFTDVVAGNKTVLWRAKAPTDPLNFATGVTEACDRIAAQVGASTADLLIRTTRFGCGTTAVTNVLASRQGLTAGLITTQGFEDLLIIAKGRLDTRDGWLEPSWTPIERSRIIGVPGRIDRAGEVIEPFDDTALLAAAEHLVGELGVQSLAISLLWSFRNPAHEQRAAGLIRQRFSDLPVFVGSELHPVIGEYERTSVAALNAVCAGAVDGIADLETQLRRQGLTAPFLILQANGGATTVDKARTAPLSLYASGPAAGAVAAAEVLALVGLKNGICADMGGTTFDVAVVEQGRPVRRQRAVVGGVVTAQSAVDVESVGSGGGSIAWIDARGVLRVGPRSAGSTPGPACYGRGGQEPTLTDAMLVLGYLDPNNFLGGAMTLDVPAAHEACGRLGEQLGMDPVEVAWGIRQIAVVDMVRATRARMASGGLDPRQQALVTYGGSAALFAADIAQATNIPTVLVPEPASVLSAFGAASASIRLERTAGVDIKLSSAANGMTEATLRKLADAVDGDVASIGVVAAGRSCQFEADLRFYRQTSEVSIPLAGDVFDPDDLAERFQSAYAARYGRGAIAMGTPIELVAIRAMGLGETERAQFPSASRDETVVAAISIREIRVSRSGPEPISAIQRGSLQPGDKWDGPVLIEDVDTTLWVPPGCHVSMDDHRTIHMEVQHDH